MDASFYQPKVIVSHWGSLLIVSSAAFLSVIDLFIVNVALPSIREGIHGSNGDSQLVIVLYLLGHATFLIIGGRLGDHYGRKNIFVWSMLLFTLASGCCGIAQNATQLNIARFCQGAFAAFMVPQSIAYVQVLFPKHEDRVKALGIYGAIAGIASVIGQFLGGVLPEIHSVIAGWRLLFLMNLPVGLLAAYISWRFLQESKNASDSRPDQFGVILLSIGLICLIYPLIRGRELGWPLWSCLLLPVSLLLLTLFVYDQRSKQRSKQAYIIDLRLFAYRDFNIGLGAVVAYFIVQDSYFLINTILWQSGLGLGSVETGNYFVLQGIGYVVAAITSIRLVGRYGKKVLQTGVLLMLAMLMLHIVMIEHRHWLLVALFMYGIGCGAVLPSLLTLALRNIPPTMAGSAAGIYVTFQQTAIALGVCITGGLFFELLGDSPSLQQWLLAYRWATGVNIFFLIMVSYFLWRL